MKNKKNVCIVSCSVLKEELQQLVKDGSLDAELVFVSKFFHVDYAAVENNLRKVLEHTLRRFKGKVVLVYGDLCLGQNGEMKRLAKEFGVEKVDTVNCIDCQLGGKGAFEAADPEHKLMFMGPGMIDFFVHMREQMLKEGVDEAALLGMFSGIEGFVLLDTCGDAEKCRRELEKTGIDVPIVETRRVGLEGVRRVVSDAVERSSGAGKTPKSP
jgi:hypothetical protein